jgi:hypothetical protein
LRRPHLPGRRSQTRETAVTGGFFDLLTTAPQISPAKLNWCGGPRPVQLDATTAARPAPPLLVSLCSRAHSRRVLEGLNAWMHLA